MKTPTDGRLGLFALAAVGLLMAGAPDASARGCHGRQVQVRVGAHRACVKAVAPVTSPAGEQRAFDRALLAERLRPRHGRGRTIGAWLGSARGGLRALERALDGPSATAASASGWKTEVRDETPADASGSALAIVTRRGKAKLTLDSSYVAKAEHCADAAGEDPGTRTRKVSLKLEVPLSGGRTLTVKSSQSTTAPFTGTANDAAALATLVLGKVKTKASARAELRDRKGRLVARLSPTRVGATITLPTALGTTVSWPEVLTDPATSFVASSALKALVRGDGASLDPLLRRFVTQMQTDAWSTYEQARGALLDAQRQWWQAGRCLAIVLETPSGARVDAGGHLPVRATAVLTTEPKHPKHPGTGPLPLSLTATAGTLAPPAATTKATGAGQADPLVFDYTAAGTAGAATVTASIASKQGLASASVPLTVSPAGPIYLKATAVSGAYDMTYAGADSTCRYESHDHYDLTLGDSSGHDGVVDGGIGTVIVPTHHSGTATGTAACSGDTQTCAHDLDDEGSYYLDINREGATATLRFHALQQPYNDCYSLVKDGGEVTGVTHPTLDTTVPWSQITGGAPFTVHVEGTFTDPNHTVTRSYTVTLHRVG
jgi:hypothetical protein